MMIARKKHPNPYWYFIDTSSVNKETANVFSEFFDACFSPFMELIHNFRPKHVTD